MHPSDSRMGGWAGITYTVGSSSVSAFPMAIWKAIGPVTVRFTLSSSQTGARTLKIATTLAFAGGRPIVSVNSWSSSTPPVPNQPDSRGVTRGTWRGNNIEYTYAIPSGTLVAGSNTLTINVASGSSGSDYLVRRLCFLELLSDDADADWVLFGTVAERHLRRARVVLGSCQAGLAAGC